MGRHAQRVKRGGVPPPETYVTPVPVPTAAWVSRQTIPGPLVYLQADHFPFPAPPGADSISIVVGYNRDADDADGVFDAGILPGDLTDNLDPATVFHMTAQWWDNFHNIPVGQKSRWVQFPP